MYRFSFTAIRYTIEQLFAFAGIAEEIALEPYLKEENPYIIISLAHKKICFRLLPEKEIQTLLDGNLPYSSIKGLCGVEIPLFVQTETPLSQTNDTLTINADIITPSFILLSRYEEWICKKNDVHGRFEYSSSLACKYNFIEIPLVDEYALWLRNALQAFIPSLKVNKRESALIPTHDIDLLYRFDKQKYINLRSIIGGDLFKNRSLRLAISSLKEWKKYRKDKKNDPYFQAIKNLCLTEQQHHLTPIVFIKAQHLGEQDATYDIDDEQLSFLLQQLKNEGVNIGLHGSYSSYNQQHILKEEKQRLTTLLGLTISTIRQHFLRFDIRQTLMQWASADMEHDYSLGFAEREGFRCGTCHPYLLYDHVLDTPSTITEHPLIVMDGTLIEYRRLPAEEAYAQLAKFRQYCRIMEGDLVILWHNHTTSRQYKTYFEKTFKRIIEQQ